MSYVAQQIFRLIPVLRMPLFPLFKKAIRATTGYKEGFKLLVRQGSLWFKIFIDRYSRWKNALGQRVYQAGSLALMGAVPNGPRAFIISRQIVLTILQWNQIFYWFQIGLLYPNNENLEYVLQRISDWRWTKKLEINFIWTMGRTHSFEVCYKTSIKYRQGFGKRKYSATEAMKAWIP